MGQEQSRFQDDPDFQRVNEAVNAEGPAGVERFIEERLNGWKNESVKFGISGRTSTGKSSFINYILGLKEGDEGAAEIGLGNTTRSATYYVHPKNKNITIVDLPGVGTILFPKKGYCDKMLIREYDYFLIFFDTVLHEDDAWLANQLMKLEHQKFALVRSKVDKDVKQGKKRHQTEEKTLSDLRTKIESEIQNSVFGVSTKNKLDLLFLISNKKPSIGEMEKLNKHILNSLSSINEDKKHAFLSSIGNWSKAIIDEKYNSLKKRVIGVTVGTSIISAVPVPGLDMAINFGILVNEVRHYINVFGLSRDHLESLKDFDHSLLKRRDFLSKSITSGVLINIIKQDLGNLAAMAVVVTASSFLDIFLPIVGSVISSVATAATVNRFLCGVLDDLRQDALTVYIHIQQK